MESILRYRYVSDPYFSPDGSCAAFVVQQASLEENTYHGDLYLLNADGGVRPLTSGGDATRFWWSARRTILFPALRSADLRARHARPPHFLLRGPREGRAALMFHGRRLTVASHTIFSSILTKKIAYQIRKRRVGYGWN